MKLSLTAGLACIALVAAVASGSVLSNMNMVSNGGFEVEAEGQGNPADWYYSSQTSWTTMAYEGNRAIMIDDQDGGAAAEWRCAYIPVTAGQVLNLNYFVDYNVPVGNFGAFVRFFNDEGAFQGQQLDLISGASSGYQNREFKTSVPSGATQADIFLFTNDVANQGSAVYDNVSLDMNRLNNGRVEKGSDNPDDWYHGANTYWVDDPNAPSKGKVLEINDVDDGGYDWRSLSTMVADLDQMQFSFEANLTGTDGNAFAFLRFFDQSNNWVGQETISLSGDTDGYVSYSSIIDLPDGAFFADVWFWTGAEAFTGNIRLDDIYAGPVVVPEPASLALLALAGVAMIRRR